MPLFRVHVRKEYTSVAYAWTYVEAEDGYQASHKVETDPVLREGLSWSEPYGGGKISASASIMPVTEEEARTWRPPC